MSLLMLSTARRATGVLYCSRCSFSTKANNLPFPSSPNPSPYEIFHLKPGASDIEIKDRYYELVRLYHPDSPAFRTLEPNNSVRHDQFRAISSAYKKLRSSSEPTVDSNITDNDLEALRRAHERRKTVERLYTNKSLDDRWKDRLIFGSILLSMVVIFYQSATTRRQALVEELSRKHKLKHATVELTKDQGLEERSL